jgi:hypothetical protein
MKTPAGFSVVRITSIYPFPGRSPDRALERDFELHVLAFSRQGGPKSHVRSLMVFGDVMIYITELADKLGIDPVEAAKSKVAINGIQDGAYPSIGATRCLETGAHYGESRAGTRCFGGRSYGILHLDFREHSFRNCPKSLERTCGVALQAAEIPLFGSLHPLPTGQIHA